MSINLSELDQKQLIALRQSIDDELERMNVEQVKTPPDPLVSFARKIYRSEFTDIPSWVDEKAFRKEMMKDPN